MNFKFSNLILFIVFAGLIAFYFVSMPLMTKHNRYTMYFLNLQTNKVGTEARYVLKNNNISKEEQFVQELVFGPMDHNFYDYFKKGTKYNSCFVDGSILYVSFPKSIVPDVESKMPFEQFYMLFKKNIFSNFSNIKEVCMFLDGVQVYAY
ncbi:MAG: GerMN domain-containing protein [Treponemataceae bacterium]